jgi:cytochrome P450
VHRHETAEGAFWAVTGHDEVRQASRDHAALSNEWGISLTAAGEDVRASLNTMMLMMDPPAHTAYRRLVSSAFTPRNPAAWTDRVDALARRIVDAVAQRGECGGRCRDLELAGPVERLESAFIAGPRAMPVRFTPAPAAVER